MKHLGLLCAALIVSGCSSTGNVQPEPADKRDYTSVSKNSHENLMMQKAVVKLIKKYKELDKKAALQEKKIKRLESKTARHDRKIKEMHSGMNTIKNFVSDSAEGDYSVEVSMPVIENRKEAKPAKAVAE